MTVQAFKRTSMSSEATSDGYRSAARESFCDPGGGNPLAAKGTLGRVMVQLKSDAVASEWLHVFDKAAALVGGDVPIIPPVEVLPGQTVTLDLEPDAIVFSSGLRIALSTSDTFAASATAKGLFLVKFSRS